MTRFHEALFARLSGLADAGGDGVGDRDDDGGDDVDR
jgi:hypothetical protein